jgi:epoxyqueuosine reductase
MDDENVSSSTSNADSGISASFLSGKTARSLALDAGFTEAGLVALPQMNESRDAQRFEQWVREGCVGSMQYLERANEQGELLRARVSIPFPWARSAIVCFASYHAAQPLSIAPTTPDAGWIARYAWSGRRETDSERAHRTKTGSGRDSGAAGSEIAAERLRPSDYHKVLLKKLRGLEARLREQVREQSGEEAARFEARGYVDTGPVVERSLAAAAGLGWTGKNTCLIHPKLGSYGFLAVLLTSLEVQKGTLAPQVPATLPARANSEQLAPPQVQLAPPQVAQVLVGGCGTCRRCIDTCPTGALDTPYRMDATRCIAYLTIEHRGAIAPELMEGMGRQVFGCDICQDVCPWNRKAPISSDPELQSRPELVNPSLDWLAALTEADWRQWFNGSPVRRAGFVGLRRNIAIAMGNSGLRRFLPWLEKLSAEAGSATENESLASAAQWALGKLRSPAAAPNDASSDAPGRG